MRNQDGLATILLVSQLVPSEDAAPLDVGEFADLCRLVAAPGALLGGGDEDLTKLGLAAGLARRVVALLARSTAMAFKVDELAQSGVATVTRFDDAYPQRLAGALRAKAPPVLYIAGEASLLERPGLGVVGSRDVSAEGGEVAKAAAEQGALLGMPLVSGGARGVDQMAMNSAFQAGGPVVGFLADSLMQRVRKPGVAAAIRSGSAVMCTPCNPAAGFSAGNAMGRNKLIYAQAKLTVVVASAAGTGGTWAGATEALSLGLGKVCVWRGRGEGPGNADLVDLGATPVSSPEQIRDLLEAAKPEGSPQPQQDTDMQDSPF